MSNRTTNEGAVQHPEGVNCSAVDAVMSHSESSGAKRLVLLAIARFINAKTLEAYPSNATIGKLAGCDARTVRRAVGELIELGELERDRQLSPLGTNVFRLPKLGGWGDSSPELHKEEEVVFNTSEELIDYMKSSGGTTPSRGGLATEIFARQLSYEFADVLIAAGRKKPHYRSDAASDEWYGVFDRLVFENFPRCSVECIRAVVARVAEPLPDGRLIYHPRDLMGGTWRVLEYEWRAAQEAPPSSPEGTFKVRSSRESVERLYALIAERDPTDRDSEELAALTGAGFSSPEGKSDDDCC